MILRMWIARSTARETTADEQTPEANGFHENCSRY